MYVCSVRKDKRGNYTGDKSWVYQRMKKTCLLRKQEVKDTSDMLWQSVPHSRTSDREGSVSDGRETSTRTIRDVDEAERRRCQASESTD